MILERLRGLWSRSARKGSADRDLCEERQALAALQEACRRDTERRDRAQEDLAALEKKEQELLAEARLATAAHRRDALSRKLRDVRAHIEELSYRIDTIYARRIQIFHRQLGELRALLELRAEPLPDRKALEEISLSVRERLDALDEAAIAAEGIGMFRSSAQPEAREDAALQEPEPSKDREND